MIHLKRLYSNFKLCPSCLRTPICRLNQQPALPRVTDPAKIVIFFSVFTVSPLMPQPHRAKRLIRQRYAVLHKHIHSICAVASFPTGPAYVRPVGEQGSADPGQLLQDPQDEAHRPGASRRSPSKEGWRRRRRRRRIACAERRRGRGGWGGEVP